MADEHFVGPYIVQENGFLLRQRIHKTARAIRGTQFEAHGPAAAVHAKRPVREFHNNTAPLPRRAHRKGTAFDDILVVEAPPRQPRQPLSTTP